jgi:hypothetical protein
VANRVSYISSLKRDAVLAGLRDPLAVLATGRRTVLVRDRATGRVNGVAQV